MSSDIRRRIVALVVAMTLLSATGSYGQFQAQADKGIQVSARYHIQSGTSKGFLIVRLDIAEGNYIYSLTQTAPIRPSTLAVTPSKSFQVGKKFKCDRRPHVVEKDPVLQTRLEKHAGTVQFYVPIRISTSTNPESIQPEVTFSGQVCSDQGYCMPISGISAKAKFAGFFQHEAKNSVPPLKQKK